MLDMLLIAAATALASLSGAAWIILFRRSAAGRSPVAWEPRRIARWGLLDVIFSIASLLCFTSLAMALVSHWFGDASQNPGVKLPIATQQAIVWAQAGASLAAMSVSALLIILRCGVSLRDLGFDRRAVWRDVRLGFAAFVVLAPPTYALQMVLVQWFESRHPIVQLMREFPEWRLVMASLFSAVVVAPVFEEYLFRAVIQGSLERLFWLRGSSRTQVPDASPLLPSSLVRPDQAVGEPEQGPEAIERRSPASSPRSAEVESPCGDAGDPHSASDREPREREASREVSRAEPRSLGENIQPCGIVGFMPIVVSSSIFAALHVSHGPDWIPLFFLALGLGYLYRQTHRLLPGIIVHFLLNSVSMGMFLIDLWSGGSGR